MHVLKISLLIFAVTPILCAGEPRDDKEPPKARPADYSDEWLEAIERLRSMPRPGEIKNGSVSAGVAEIYDLTPEQKAKVTDVVAAFETELLKRAAKWEDEERTLRDEFEIKVIQALPENRRASAKKVLDFSHSKWVSPLDRESKFKKEYTRRVNELRDDRARMSVEELNEKRKVMQAWVKAERQRINAQDEEVLKGVNALLTAEEAQRLDQADKLRKQ